MRTEYSVSTARPATPTSTGSVRSYGLAFIASGIIGVAIGIVTLSYPAAVATNRWSYPFDASAQWIVSCVLALTHVLTLVGFVGVIVLRPFGRSRAAVVGLWAAIAGYAALTVCEVLSGAVGTRPDDSAFANAVSQGFAVASLLVAAGSIVAGAVIVRRLGIRNVGWSMVMWSGIVIVVLVTPANVTGNVVFEMVSLTLWSLTFVPLGKVLTREITSGNPRNRK